MKSEQRLIDANELERHIIEKYSDGEQLAIDVSDMPTVLTIPENPTNGDMIKALFPEIEMIGASKDTLDYSLGGFIHRVLKSWWNASYKAESEDKE